MHRSQYFAVDSINSQPTKGTDTFNSPFGKAPYQSLRNSLSNSSMACRRQSICCGGTSAELVGNRLQSVQVIKCVNCPGDLSFLKIENENWFFSLNEKITQVAHASNGFNQPPPFRYPALNICQFIFVKCPYPRLPQPMADLPSNTHHHNYTNILNYFITMMMSRMKRKRFKFIY